MTEARKQRDLVFFLSSNQLLAVFKGENVESNRSRCQPRTDTFNDWIQRRDLLRFSNAELLAKVATSLLLFPSLSLALSLSLPFSPDSPSPLRLTFRYASVAASPFIHVCLPRFHFRRKCCSGNGSFSAGLSKRRGGCFRRTFLLTSLMSSILMLHRARFARELDYCLKSSSLRHLVKLRADLCSRTSTSGNSEPEDQNRYFFQVTFFFLPGRSIFVRIEIFQT